MAIAKRDPKVAVASAIAGQRRVGRRPQHRFNLKLLPYQIQPFLLAPILPGETFQNLMVQSQMWSDPLNAKMKNIGWWCQYNFFYVRHRDLPSSTRDLLAQMMLDPDTDISAIVGARNTSLYTFSGGVKWTELCLQHVVSEYFRDDGEDWNEATANGLPLAAIYGAGSSDGLDKLTLASDYEDRRVDLIDSDGSLYASDLNLMQQHWVAMREAGLTEMDYQDFVKTYGSSIREDEDSPNLHRAEDLGSFREFTYPTNTVEPTTGVPAVAVGWRTAKTLGKRAFADEPGFIFGTVNVRPKVYLKYLKGSLAGAMDDVRAWLPAVLQDKADVGHIEFTNTTGPLAYSIGNDEGYWIDIRDLLLYGDQFINYDPEVTGEMPFMNLPAADGSNKYPSASQIAQFFSNPETGVFTADGLCSLNILGYQKKSQPGLVLGAS